MKKSIRQTVSILLALLMLLPCFECSLAEQAPLVIAYGWTRKEFSNYTQATGQKIELAETSGDMMETISTAYAIKDDRVDIYLFTAYSGLYLIKEKNFYTAVEDSQILTSEYEKLYPAFQQALNDEGHIVGWLFSVQPLVQDVDGVLGKFELAVPETFEEFLDTCQYIYENELLGTKYKMTDSYAYTQRDFLNFYMKSYIASNYMAGNVPDFANEKFLSTVQRIKDELPAQAGEGTESDERTPFFYLSTVFEYISTSMLPLPRVLETQDNAIEVYATIAIVNPFSKNKETAIEFLEYCAQNPASEAAAYVYDSTRKEPIADETQLATYNKLQAELDGYLQLETLTQEQQDRVAQLEMMIPEYKAKSYKISPEAIAHYQELAQNLLVNEGSPVSYDAQLRQYASQYLSGLMTLEQFSEKCQSHIERIFKELQ